MGVTRVLYATDFHGSEAFFRKFLAAAMQYKAQVLIVGGDVTGKAMVPVVHKGGGRYEGFLFNRREQPSTPAELEKLKQTISNVGFYPLVLEQDEADALEADAGRMGAVFERAMCDRIRRWLALADEKLTPQGIRLYFMPGNDDLYSIDAVIDEFPSVANPDGRRLWIDDDHELIGVSNANMTPWRCARDLEDEQLEARLTQVAALLERPSTAVMALHVPPYDSGIDVCPELDANLKIIARGGQILMKPVGSPAVRRLIERLQPLVTLHGHIHEAPGHTRIGRTLCINSGSEYAEGIMKAAILNLERDKVKGHMLISA
jgi:Icc-related predicted phosphoesterase